MLIIYENDYNMNYQNNYVGHMLTKNNTIKINVLVKSVQS